MTTAEKVAALTGTEVQELETEFVVAPEHHFALAELLQSEGYTFYITVAATHFAGEVPNKKNPEGSPETFQVATVLRKPEPGASSFACWRVELAAGEPIDSLVPLFEGADWQEREQFDLVGVVFKNHPDLRRLMMPEDWEGHPLRRDYAIETAHPPWR